MFFATPRREPLRHPARPLPGREVSGARPAGQSRRQGRRRPGDRPPDDHLRRPAPAALLALQRPLPRRPAQPARHPVGVRHLRRPRSTPAPGSTRTRPPPVLALHPHGRASAAAPARRGWRRSAPGATSPAPRTRTPPPTRPFYLHLTRTDAEQEITSYSATLPPGLLGKIAGIPFCPENLIEAAKHQTGAESATDPGLPGRRA